MQHALAVVTGWIAAAAALVYYSTKDIEQTKSLVKTIFTIVGVVAGAMFGGLGDMFSGFNLAQG